ncbi:hypothetical protein P8452_60926 [Trifolium repens]|nr:hypothetical protein P8452_60926 [Trifolium repens]
MNNNIVETKIIGAEMARSAKLNIRYELTTFMILNLNGECLKRVSKSSRSSKEPKNEGSKNWSTSSVNFLNLTLNFVLSSIVTIMMYQASSSQFRNSVRARNYEDDAWYIVMVTIEDVTTLRARLKKLLVT